MKIHLSYTLVPLCRCWYNQEFHCIWKHKSLYNTKTLPLDENVTNLRGDTFGWNCVISIPQTWKSILNVSSVSCCGFVYPGRPHRLWFWQNFLQLVGCVIHMKDDFIASKSLLPSLSLVEFYHFELFNGVFYGLENHTYDAMIVLWYCDQKIPLYYPSPPEYRGKNLSKVGKTQFLNLMKGPLVSSTQPRSSHAVSPTPTQS